MAAHALTAALSLALAGGAMAAQDGILKNWFDDPFFQVRAGLAHCPAPLGPLQTEAAMKSEAHSRIERGASCWLAGRCAQPNAYLYDAALAASIREHFAGSAAFMDASLWITVKRKFVWVEGCVADAAQNDRIAAFIQALPEVERVIIKLMPGVAGPPPYTPRPPDPALDGTPQ